jgi:hypothetical protein
MLILPAIFYLRDECKETVLLATPRISVMSMLDRFASFLIFPYTKSISVIFGKTLEDLAGRRRLGVCGVEYLLEKFHCRFIVSSSI